MFTIKWDSASFESLIKYSSDDAPSLDGSPALKTNNTSDLLFGLVRASILVARWYPETSRHGRNDLKNETPKFSICWKISILFVDRKARRTRCKPCL